MRGQTGTLSFVEDPKAVQPVLPEDLTIQRHNLRAANKPFILFEQGNRMRHTVHKPLAALSGPGSCCHWPVGQAICDGRTSQAADRPTSFLGFPISSPPIHEAEGRLWWNGLYGMTDQPIDHLVTVARSWATAAALRIESAGFAGGAYDTGQRVYRLTRTDAHAPRALDAEISASAESPVHNPALEIAGWGPGGAALQIDGQAARPGTDFRLGHRRRLEGTDLILWIRLAAQRPVRLTVRPV